MARAGVVDRDPGRRCQAGAQHVTRLADEAVLAADQQSHDLSLGDLDADRREQGDQPWDGDLTLVILCQHEAAQLRPEMAVDPGRQRRHHRAAIGGHPALAAEPDGDRPQHHILDQEILVAFETGARRHCGAQHPVLN